MVPSWGDLFLEVSSLETEISMANYTVLIHGKLFNVEETARVASRISVASATNEHDVPEDTQNDTG